MRAAARVWMISDTHYRVTVHDDNDAMLCMSRHESRAAAVRAARRLAREYDVIYDATVRVCDVMRVSETDIAYRLQYAIGQTA